MGEMVKKKKESRMSESEARFALLELAHMMSVSMSLTAIINLQVPDAIWQDGSNTPLSAAHILARIGPHGGTDAENLQRILRMLSSYDIFNEHLSSGGERKYSLTDIGKTLVDDDKDTLMRGWALVGEAVEDPTREPFEKANGESPIECYVKHSHEMSLLFKSFSGMSVPFMREILQICDGFRGIQTLVDVGGNSGISLRIIMENYPNLRNSINYVLPHMFAHAPLIPGVTHVGGNALESVPRGDGIFIKWVFLGLTDEENKLVFQNCYKALPVNGKLIVCEPVLPELTDESRRTRALLGLTYSK